MNQNELHDLKVQDNIVALLQNKHSQNNTVIITDYKCIGYITKAIILKNKKVIFGGQFCPNSSF